MEKTITLKLSELSPSALTEIIECLAEINENDERLLALKKAWDEVTRD